MFTNIGFLRQSGGSRFNHYGRLPKDSSGNSLSPPRKIRKRTSSDPQYVRENYSKTVSRRDPDYSVFRSSLGNSQSQRLTNLKLGQELPSRYFSIAPVAGNSSNIRNIAPYRPPLLNAHKTNCIFNVYGVETIAGSAGGVGAKRFLGMGFLVTRNLGLTAYVTLPSEGYASRAAICFLDSPQAFYRCNPADFFFAHKDLKFTIFAIERRDARDRRLPLPLHSYFTLRGGDPVVIFYTSVETKTVLLLEDHMFSYVTGHDLPQGLPVFDYLWDLQGVLHTTTSYKVNQATRVDVIYNFMLSVRHMVSHPELDMMLETNSYEPPDQAPIAIPAERKQQYLYWFEWFTRNIYKYEVSTERWTRSEPTNMRELDSMNIWYFLWNSRICYLPNGNVAIVGGVSDQRGTIKNEALIYRSNDNTIHKLPNMIEAREACAVVSTDKRLYALGGKYPMSTCEMFAFEGYSWSVLAPMKYGRYDHCACVVPNDKHIYVAGGMPAELVGKCVERYDTEFNSWEVLELSLPDAYVHHGIVPLSTKKIAILGGKHTKRVSVLEITQTQVDRHFVPRLSQPSHKLLEAPSLPDLLETIFPPVISEETDSIILMCGREGYSHLRAHTYPLRGFSNLYNSISLPKPGVSRSANSSYLE